MCKLCESVRISDPIGTEEALNSFISMFDIKEKITENVWFIVQLNPIDRLSFDYIVIYTTEYALPRIKDRNVKSFFLEPSLGNNSFEKVDPENYILRVENIKSILNNLENA